MKDVRVEGLTQWAKSADLNVEIPASATLEPVSDDASFRRYFRFPHHANGVVFVDAPPEHEDNASFVRISAALKAADLDCPVVLGANLAEGYLAVSDLGDRLYLDEINANPDAASMLYRQATNALLQMIPVRCAVPAYDEKKLREEMSLFGEWFINRQLGLALNTEVSAMLDEVSNLLVRSALDQPVGFVHRDYHSRNLMVRPGHGPGIIDFQDAVLGPVTYDLVSLYKDCYHRFDREVVGLAVQAFHESLTKLGLVDATAPFLRWFDLMGAQRHLKCAGIFSRLNLRDGKPGYLGDIPLVVDYLIEVAALYPELSAFHAWLVANIQPEMSSEVFQR